MGAARRSSVSTSHEYPGTFSIAVRDPEANAFGAAVTTGTVAVGATCPYVSEHAAVVTQSYTRTEHGRDGVARADDGEPVDEALESLLDADEHAAYRQVHGVGEDSEFAFTGDSCVPWCGSRVGSEFTVAGNMLAGPEVLEEAATAYETGDGDVADRLVSALEAGEAAGGDERGELSAALLVAAPEPEFYHNLRVDYSETPVADLRDLLTEARSARDRIRAGTDEAFDGDYPEEILEFGIKY
ncbi:DUF1028 domain-containing protein [Halobaculum roseum]|uniref:DUF1028 domain-containing protein n=1 Tax=Halobaculum roseum TaxID=2175149 RepID=A0ABD5MUC6_9EURY|nr:DUF1028 domain-containing protein [Halobaculum roseum]